MNIKLLTMPAVLVLTAGLTLNASQLVHVTLEGTSGLSNGTNEVLPYVLSINGQNILADCYDFLDTVEIGETWTANIDTLAEAATSGRFSSYPGALLGYELIGALSMVAMPTEQAQIDIQEDMWNVFDPGTFTATTGMLSDLSLANADIPTFDFSQVVFIEPTLDEHVQAFVTLSTPEPASFLLIVLGLTALGSLRSRETKVQGREP